jgi:hypothetical protein
MRQITILHTNGRGISPAVRDALVKMASAASVEIHLRLVKSLDLPPEPMAPPESQLQRYAPDFQAPGRARHKKGKR